MLSFVGTYLMEGWLHPAKSAPLQLRELGAKDPFIAKHQFELHQPKIAVNSILTQHHQKYQFVI